MCQQKRGRNLFIAMSHLHKTLLKLTRTVSILCELIGIRKQATVMFLYLDTSEHQLSVTVWRLKHDSQKCHDDSQKKISEST